MPDKPAPPCLTLEIEHTDDLTIVRCHGQLVSELSNIFYSKVRPIIPATKRIVLDLSDVTRTFPSSANVKKTKKRFDDSTGEASTDKGGPWTVSLGCSPS